MIIIRRRIKLSVLHKKLSFFFWVMMFTQLTSYLDRFNLINNIQHGFRPGKSVTTAAVSFIESLIDSVDKGQITVGIFMDLTKAFDCVIHNLLLTKLSLLGVSKSALKWFESYIKDRHQSVEIGHITSDNQFSKFNSSLQPVKFGVPQGSILGPLLFVCYVNDINSALSFQNNSNLCLYADDSNLKISSNNIEEVELVSFIELGNIGCLLQNHNLHLNSQKTNFVRFKTKQNKTISDLMITYDTKEITANKTTQFLGLSIDEHLSWDDHINKLTTKICSGLYALSKMSIFCNTKTMKQIYFAHIHSHIAFGACLYGATTKLNLDKILKLQKRAIRTILKLKYNESVKEHFKTLKIPTVYSQYIFDTIMISVINQSNLPVLDKKHQYNTRHKSETATERYNLKFYEKKPTFIGRKFFKQIPISIKSEKNVLKFKLDLKAYLVDKCLYSIEEFMYHTH